MSYIFNGDFVDRGAHQLEIIVLLFSLKALYPEQATLLRHRRVLYSPCHLRVTLMMASLSDLSHARQPRVPRAECRDGHIGLRVRGPDAIRCAP